LEYSGELGSTGSGMTAFSRALSSARFPPNTPLPPTPTTPSSRRTSAQYSTLHSGSRAEVLTLGSGASTMDYEHANGSMASYDVSSGQLVTGRYLQPGHTAAFLGGAAAGENDYERADYEQADYEQADYESPYSAASSMAPSHVGTVVSSTRYDNDPHEYDTASSTYDSAAPEKADILSKQRALSRTNVLGSRKNSLYTRNVPEMYDEADDVDDDEEEEEPDYATMTPPPTRPLESVSEADPSDATASEV